MRWKIWESEPKEEIKEEEDTYAKRVRELSIKHGVRRPALGKALLPNPKSQNIQDLEDEGRYLEERGNPVSARF